MIMKFSHQILFFIRTGGGVMLAVDQSIPTKIIPSPVDIEVVSVHFWWSIRLSNSYFVYNPPNSGKIYQQKLVSFLSDIMQFYNNIVISMP